MEKILNIDDFESKYEADLEEEYNEWGRVKYGNWKSFVKAMKELRDDNE